jgi:hypothetical protein
VHLLAAVQRGFVRISNGGVGMVIQLVKSSGYSTVLDCPNVSLLLANPSVRRKRGVKFITDVACNSRRPASVSRQDCFLCDRLFVVVRDPAEFYM